MPRITRGDSVGGIYHIINRGNMRMQVFDDEEDYTYFLELLKKGMEREDIDLHAYTLMPNHFHLLVIPKGEGSLSRFMQWVMTSHVRYYHRKNKTSGHIWQGRYKSFIVQKESYYLTLIRYIEANAKRAELVKEAKEWIYSSLHEREYKNINLLSKSYVKLEDDWSLHVDTPLSLNELEKIRNSVNRQAPLGDKVWQVETAQKFGLESSLNSRGRPRKTKKRYRYME